MLPQVEHLRTAADKARAELDAAMAAVVQAEASHPLTTPGALTHAGLAVPRVLVRGSDGTMHTQQQAGGGGAAAVDGSGGGDSSGGLVAVPAVKERKEMYRKEQAETGRCGECTASLVGVGTAGRPPVSSRQSSSVSHLHTSEDTTTSSDRPHCWWWCWCCCCCRCHPVV